jgi:hypothetical protein
VVLIWEPISRASRALMYKSNTQQPIATQGEQGIPGARHTHGPTRGGVPPVDDVHLEACGRREAQHQGASQLPEVLLVWFFPIWFRFFSTSALQPLRGFSFSTATHGWSSRSRAGRRRRWRRHLHYHRHLLPSHTFFHFSFTLIFLAMQFSELFDVCACSPV